MKGKDYAVLHLIINSLLTFEAMRGTIPSMIELMVWFECPQENIQQAIDAVNLIRSGYRDEQI